MLISLQTRDKTKHFYLNSIINGASTVLFLKCKRHENLIISEVVRTMFMYNLLPLSSSNGTTNSISLNNMSCFLALSKLYNALNKQTRTSVHIKVKW